VNVRKRLDTSFNRLFEAFGCVGLRKMDGSLYGRQQILTAVFCFSSQRGDLLLTSFLPSNVPRDFRCSNDLAFGIFDGRNGQRNDN